jgi:excisionase family DNA binding protein
MTTNDRNSIHVDLDDDFEDLLTLREVAQILRVPEATLRYWIHKGTGPANLKIGRHIRYPRAALQRWMREQRRGGGQHEVA